MKIISRLILTFMFLSVVSCGVVGVVYHVSTVKNDFDQCTAYKMQGNLIPSKSIFEANIWLHCSKIKFDSGFS